MELKDDTPVAPNGISLIHVLVAVESMESSNVLLAMRYKRKKHDTPEYKALWDGCWELGQQAAKQVAMAKDRGQLLFCFPGTTVLQQGGAA